LSRLYARAFIFFTPPPQLMFSGFLRGISLDIAAIRHITLSAAIAAG